MALDFFRRLFFFWDMNSQNETIPKKGKRQKKQAGGKENFARQLLTVGVWLLGKKYRIPVELFDLVNSAKTEEEAIKIIETNK